MDVYYISGLHAFDYEQSRVEKLDAIFDMSLGAEYFINNLSKNDSEQIWKHANQKDIEWVTQPRDSRVCTYWRIAIAAWIVQEE